MEKKSVPFLLQYRDDNPVIQFAAQELQKYLVQMDPSISFHLSPAIITPGEGLSLGLYEDFGLPVPAVTSPEMDDCLHIAVNGGQGVIAGLNPRAVLLGVYRFLEEAGCRFLRPGKDGELIPAVALEMIHVQLDSTPTYRYRGLCIEGAVSLEHMLDNVDWAAKVGLNSYFLEFMVPFTFFDRWYSHEQNPEMAQEPVTPEQVSGFMQEIESEIFRRGLAYHHPGHGWTCESLGIPGLGWFPTEFNLKPETRELLAEVNGKRELFHGVALNTNLCYSNPKARQTVVEYAVQYVKEKPGIDFLHVWLADSLNNHCECPNCREMLPADLYIKLLNEMDSAFQAAGLETKIVFIVYLELLWAPEKEKLNHPDRFVLLFAPISRSYSKPYDTDLEGIRLPEYHRNQVVLPTSIRENLAYLRAWQKLFSGDSFTYEYYFMWDCYLDPGYYEAARVLHEDVRRLKQIGLNGIMSDQSQRSFFPTAFGMHVMARMLWDDTREFDDLADWYFRADFGEDGPAVRAYMQALSRLFDPPYVRGERHPGDEALNLRVAGVNQSAVDDTAARNLAQVPGVIEDFRQTIQKNLQHPLACRARSWQILAYHAELCLLLARALEERAQGHAEEARRWWEQTKAYARQTEKDLHPVLDVFEFISVLQSRFA